MLSAGCSLFPSVFQLPRESPCQHSPVPIPGGSWLCREAEALQGASPPPPPAPSPLFSMRAGRALAGLRLPRHSCGCCCLQCPLVTCSRYSHNMRGGGRLPHCHANRISPSSSPFDFALTTWLGSCLVQQLAGSAPLEITEHQTLPRGKPFAPSILHLLFFFLHKLDIFSDLVQLNQCMSVSANLIWISLKHIYYIHVYVYQCL